jgi:fucose permease
MRSLGIPLTQGGLPAVTFFLGCIVGLLILNLLLNTIPVKCTLVGGALVQGAALASVGLFSRGPWSFFVAQFFTGLPCMVVAGIPGMWLSVHVREKTAWAMNLLVLVSASAMVVTPLIIGMFLGAGAGWRWIYAGEAVLVLAVAAALTALPLADIPGRENLRLRQLSALVAYRPLLLVSIAFAAFVYLGAESTLMVWLPKFGVDVFGASAGWAGTLVTLYWVGQIVGRMATIPATKRMMASTLQLAGALCMAVLAAALAFSPSLLVCSILAFSTGLGAAGTFSHVASYASRFPKWHAGVVFNLYQVTGGVGGMVFPYIVGPVAVGWGFRAAISVAAVGALVVAGMALVLRSVSGEARLPVEEAA